MSFLLRFSACCVLSLALFTCDEIPPTLNPGGGTGGGGIGLENQQRQVLIEEFTGVRCVNCPAGSETIEALLDIHGPQLVAVSIHSGTFSQPYNDSEFNFRTAEGTSIQSYVDAPLGYPTAVVNRRKFTGEESRQLGQSQWAGYIAQELQTAPRVKLEVESSYDPVTRSLSALVRMHPQENISENDLRLSLFLTETNIVDKQLTPDGEKDDYVHKHVFRDAISAFDGRPINQNLILNTPVGENFSTVLEPEWVAENCHLIAFVHVSGEQLDVLQAIEVPVVE